MQLFAHGPLAFTVTVCTSALVLLSAACAISPAPGHIRHVGLINRLDRVMQARFQAEDAGQFGGDRIGRGNGHRSVGDLMDSESSSERAALRPVMDAPSFVIIGLLHLRHKPGKFVEDHSRMKLPPFKPYSSVVEVSGTSDAHASRTYMWSIANINKASLWAARAAKQGRSVDGTYGKFYVAVRPIRATHQSCIGCHAGTRKNDVLGAMVYMLAPTPHQEPARAITNGI